MFQPPLTTRLKTARGAVLDPPRAARAGGRRGGVARARGVGPVRR
ncbi:hypothetical protein [Nocardia sp. NPDC051832]